MLYLYFYNDSNDAIENSNKDNKVPTNFSDKNENKEPNTEQYKIKEGHFEWSERFQCNIYLKEED